MGVWHFSLLVSAALVLEKLLVSAYRQVQLYSFAKSNGCAPCQRMKQWDGLIGFGVLHCGIQDFKSCRTLEVWQRFSNTIGHTFRFWFLGSRRYVTSDPENMKTLLSLSSSDYDRGPDRQRGMGATWLKGYLLRMDMSGLKQELC